MPVKPHSLTAFEKAAALGRAAPSHVGRDGVSRAAQEMTALAERQTSKYYRVSLDVVTDCRVRSNFGIIIVGDSACLTSTVSSRIPFIKTAV